MSITFENIEGNGELHLKILKAICGNTEDKSMVDLGTCEAAVTSKLVFKEKIYIDILYRKLQDESEQKNFIQYNALDYFNDKCSYCDVAIALDFIEHLSKQQGHELINQMASHSGKQIIFTPLGEYIIETVKTTNPDAHRSGWMPKDFEQLGWATIVLPNFHPTLGIGAFYSFHCENTEQDFERIKNDLSWIILQKNIVPKII